MEIIISNNTSKPIYEQITTQMKAKIISGELEQGQQIPPMRALARTLHVSVITVQKAYEDLTRAGFIETTVGRGSFVAGVNKDLIQEENRKKIEAYLEKAVAVAKTNDISKKKLIDILNLFYEGDDSYE